MQLALVALICIPCSSW